MDSDLNKGKRVAIIIKEEANNKFLRGRQRLRTRVLEVTC